MSSVTRQDARCGYRGTWFADASALPLEGGLLRPHRLASLLATLLWRPRRAAALVALLSRTRSEEVVLSGSTAGRALGAYFDQRALGVFPQNRFCRGVLILPPDHSAYLRGRSRQALRTNLRKADAAGIWCEVIDDWARAFADITEIVNARESPALAGAEEILASWPPMLSAPETTLAVARDELGKPLAAVAAVIDDSVCLIRVAVASSHAARWALHNHIVRILIARDVKYLVVDGGGPFGALGFGPSVHQYQRMLGFELRHLSVRAAA